MEKPFYKRVYERFQLFPAYHMTHIDNFESIIKSGGISCYQKIKEQEYKDISLPEVQEIRSIKLIPETRKKLHNLRPSLFGKKNPYGS